MGKNIHYRIKRILIDMLDQIDYLINEDERKIRERAYDRQDYYK